MEPKRYVWARILIFLFGYCALQLCPATNPVATPAGIIFSKDAIVEHLANQKIELKKQQEAFEQQCRMDLNEQDEERKEQERKKLESFDDLGTRDAVAPRIHAERSVEDKTEVKVGFWVPAHAPTAKASRVKAPSKHCLCPVTNKPLRLKSLIPIDLKFDEEARKNRGSSIHVVCGVTGKAIKFQKVVCLKPSGVVMLKSCVKEVVEPSMTCPITGKALRKKDIIELVPGGTGFSSHNKVEAKQYRPNI